MRRFLYSFLIPLATFGQAEVKPRTLGAVFDPATGGVRPMYGASGAALLDERFDLGVEFAAAAVSSRHGYVLGSEAGRLRAVRFTTGPRVGQAGPGTGQSLGDVDGAADRIGLSPAETVAVAYSSESRTLWILDGLPGGLRLAGSFTVPGAAEVTAFAVADDGALALAATADGAVLAFERGAAARQVAAAGRIAQIRFVEGAALLADEMRESVLRLALADFSLSTAARLPGPVIDAAFTDDGRRLISIARDLKVVYLFDAASGEMAAVACDCSPSRLAPLPGRSRFLLTEPEHGAVWILDAGAREPVVFFVPSAAREEE